LTVISTEEDYRSL